MSSLNGTAVAVVASIGTLLALARLTVRVIDVSGQSMEPALLAGSKVLALRWWPKRWLRPGQVVLLRARQVTGMDGLIVKRVENVAGQTVLMPGSSYRLRDYANLDANRLPGEYTRLRTGEIFVLGDNPAGTDSRRWGPISVDAVAGRVLTWSAIAGANWELKRSRRATRWSTGDLTAASGRAAHQDPGRPQPSSQLSDRRDVD